MFRRQSDLETLEGMSQRTPCRNAREDDGGDLPKDLRWVGQTSETKMMKRRRRWDRPDTHSVRRLAPRPILEACKSVCMIF